MKTIIMILLTFTIMSCDEPKSNHTKTNDVEVIDRYIPKKEKIMNEVSHGLYKVQLDDTTTILIYRGVESCAMLQLK
jgi:hypothetical protein